MLKVSRLRGPFITLVAGLVAGLSCAAVQAQSPSAPNLSNNCAGCHGTNGYSAKPMPIIAGLSQPYFSRVMRQFKNGERPSTIMGRLAKGYTDAEIDEMAAFFSSQIWKSPEQELNPAKIAKGREIHEEKCAVCHRDNGRFQNAETPRIAGQWSHYLEFVLQEYWRVGRKMPNRFMTIVVQPLTTSDISALSQFYASVK